MDSTPSLLDDLSHSLAKTHLRTVIDPRGREWLHVPGHDEHVIPTEPRRNRGWRLTSPPSPEIYEEAATLIFSRLVTRLRPKTVFDIGAARGYFTILAASHQAARPEVFAFEIRPGPRERLAERISELGWADRVHTPACGLSDVHMGTVRAWAAGVRLFEHKPRSEEYQERIWRRLKFYLKGNTSRALREVELTISTIDRFCSDHDTAPQLIKLDVDGYEGKVLRGAEKLLRTARPTLLLELHRDEMQRAGTRVEVADLLFHAGYGALFLTDHHDRTRCQLVRVQSGHALLARQETDMLVFYPLD